jgi:hypothetical protein
MNGRDYLFGLLSLPRSNAIERLGLLAGCALTREMAPKMPNRLGLGPVSRMILNVSNYVNFMERYADSFERDEDLETLKACLQGIDDITSTSLICQSLCNLGLGAAVETFAEATAAGLAGEDLKDGILRDIFGDQLDGGDPAFGAEVRDVARHVYDRTGPYTVEDLVERLERDDLQDHIVCHHLRSGRAHYRGCWALDGILGKRSDATEARHRLEALGVIETIDD